MNKVFKNEWVVGISMAVIGAIASTIVADYYNKISIGRILYSIYGFISSILNFEIKLWWLLVGLLTILAITYILSIFSTDENTIKEAPKPKFCSYTEGVFLGHKWSWEWYISAKKDAWLITDLSIHCPLCETRMKDEGSDHIYGHKYSCPRCFQKLNNHNFDKENIELVIHDNIDRGLVNI